MKQKKRSLRLDPATSLDIRAATKRAWLSTRKKTVTMGNENHSTAHTGLFDTDGFGWDTVWVIIVVILEVFSLAQLRRVGAFESFAILGGFCLVDFLCAAFVHSGTAGWAEYRAQFQLARNRDEQVWAGAFRPALWRRIVKWIGIAGLAASALLKSLFFVTNAQFSIVAVAVPVAYGVIFFAHLTRTGFWLAELWFRFLLSLDWRRFAAGDVDLQYSWPRKLNFESASQLDEVSVNNQRLEHDSNGEYTLVVRGVLQDDEAVDLADQQSTPEAKAEVLRACLQFQLGQLNLNPNQEITAPPPMATKASALLLPALVLVSLLSMSGCAKPKAKVADVKTIDVLVVASEIPGNALPAGLIEIFTPFVVDGVAVVPNLKVRSRREGDRVVCDAEVSFDRNDLKPGWLNQMLGASGTPVENLMKIWSDQIRKPLTLREVSAEELGSEALPSDIDLIKMTVEHLVSPKVFSHGCRDLAGLGTDPLEIKSATDFQEAARRFIKESGHGQENAMVLLDGFALYAANSAATEPPRARQAGVSTPSKIHDVPDPVRKRLPEPVRAILDRGTPRVAATIYFATNSAELPVTAVGELERVAAEVRNHPSSKVVIWANSDRLGSQEHNLRLSRERALAPARELQRRNIPIAAALGLGDALELDLTSTAEGLKLNRRADIVIIDAPELRPQPSPAQPPQIVRQP